MADGPSMDKGSLEGSGLHRKDPGPSGTRPASLSPERGVSTSGQASGGCGVWERSVSLAGTGTHSPQADTQEAPGWTVFLLLRRRGMGRPCGVGWGPAGRGQSEHARVPIKVLALFGQLEVLSQ